MDERRHSPRLSGINPDMYVKSGARYIALENLDKEEYKTLQAIALSMNLPGNLKGHELIEGIVARKHRRENEVKQLLERVQKERADRKHVEYAVHTRSTNKIVLRSSNLLVPMNFPKDLTVFPITATKSVQPAYSKPAQSKTPAAMAISLRRRAPHTTVSPSTESPSASASTSSTYSKFSSRCPPAEFKPEPSTSKLPAGPSSVELPNGLSVTKLENVTSTERGSSVELSIRSESTESATGSSESFYAQFATGSSASLMENRPSTSKMPHGPLSGSLVPETPTSARCTPWKTYMNINPRSHRSPLPDPKRCRIEEPVVPKEPQEPQVTQVVDFKDINIAIIYSHDIKPLIDNQNWFITSMITTVPVKCVEALLTNSTKDSVPEMRTRMMHCSPNHRPRTTAALQPTIFPTIYDFSIPACTLRAVSIIRPNDFMESPPIFGRIHIDALCRYIMGSEEPSFAVVENENPDNLGEEPTHSAEAQPENKEDAKPPIKKEDGIFGRNFILVALYKSRASLPTPFRCLVHGFETIVHLFNCSAPIPTGTQVCYSVSLHGISHSVETYSQYRPQACIYVNNKVTNPASRSRQMQNNIPERCLLQPEHALSYDVPKFYFRNAKNALMRPQIQPNASRCFPPLNIENDIACSTQVHYNVLLPNKNKTLNNNINQPKTSNYVELKPRTREVNYPPASNSNVMDIEASIPPLNSEEERFIFNSLNNIQNLDATISETYQQIMASQHYNCVSTQIYCPFYHTECYWFESIPLIPRHIRQMHHEKIVPKKRAEYFINIYQLEQLRDRGVKIIQEFNHRMFIISLCSMGTSIYVTIQEICESIDQHAEKVRAILVVRHQTGNRGWKGDIPSMHISLAHLWRSNTALILPIQTMRLYQTKHIRLFVEVGI